MLKKFVPFYKFIRNYTTSKEKYTVVMVRHGESEYNKNNLFTGWFNSRLSEKGKEEAKLAGETLYKSKYKFDIAFTSVLSRAKDSLSIILKEVHQEELFIRTSWRLNERHYGDLTGLNKAETSIKYGSKNVQKWRRGFSLAPPPMTSKHKHYISIVEDPRYKNEDVGEFPMSESLEMTVDRTLPYWNGIIIPEIKSGKKVLIVAHGNSLRGLVKHLDQISDEDIVNVNIPTGIPFIYKLDEHFVPVPHGSLLYLGDPELVKEAIDKLTKKVKPKKKRDM